MSIAPQVELLQYRNPDYSRGLRILGFQSWNVLFFWRFLCRSGNDVRECQRTVVSLGIMRDTSGLRSRRDLSKTVCEQRIEGINRRRENRKRKLRDSGVGMM